MSAEGRIQRNVLSASAHAPAAATEVTATAAETSAAAATAATAETSAAAAIAATAEGRSGGR